jgi:hypothetical protein
MRNCGKGSFAMLLALIGVAVGLIGWGVSATFTDGATASQSIKVGTFGITVSSTTAGAVVVNSGTTHTVTLTSPDVLSSAAGTAPLAFKVTSTGTIPANLHVAITTSPAAPFSSILAAPVADVVLSSGQSQDYAAGLSWPELFNPQLGQSYSVAYTVSATG